MNKWYQLEKNKVLQELKTTSDGLSDNEVRKRLEEVGYNELPKSNKENIFTIFIGEFKDPIVLVLIVTIIFSLFIHEVIDALAISFIVLVDILMGTIQEWKARKNAEALSSMIKFNVKVLRNQKEVMIDSRYLVPGDIVFLESGNKVSADLRILESKNLQLNESALTGESLAVTKSEKKINENLPLSERSNMVYAGSSVITGRAKAIVVETGIHTEIGKIASHVSTAKEEPSPLTIRMKKFSKQIAKIKRKIVKTKETKTFKNKNKKKRFEISHLIVILRGL